jgi:KUP system potassium uptake protein
VRVSPLNRKTDVNEQEQRLGSNARDLTLQHHAQAAPQNQPFSPLTVAVLGMVYGDIGTSPIYALRESFSGHNAIPVSPGNILGILSLIFWTLILLEVLGASMLGVRGILQAASIRSFTWLHPGPCIR